MTDILIPFNKPDVIGSEIDYVLSAIKNRHLSGDEEFTKKCNQYLEDAIDVKKALNLPLHRSDMGR